MVNATRRRELVESIERHLAEDTERRHLTSRGRVDWLSHHLGLYIGRFTAFADLPHDRVAGLLDSDLFAAVEVGTGRLASELRVANAPARLLDDWQAYLDALDSVRRAANHDSVAALRSAVDAWQAAFAAAKW